MSTTSASECSRANRRARADLPTPGAPLMRISRAMTPSCRPPRHDKCFVERPTASRQDDPMRAERERQRQPTRSRQTGDFSPADNPPEQARHAIANDVRRVSTTKGVPSRSPSSHARQLLLLVKRAGPSHEHAIKPARDRRDGSFPVRPPVRQAPHSPSSIVDTRPARGLRTFALVMGERSLRTHPTRGQSSSRADDRTRLEFLAVLGTGGVNGWHFE